MKSDFLFWKLYVFAVISSRLVFSCNLETSVDKFCVKSGSEPKMASKKLIALDFEVFGKVQGVFFRKNTVEQGKKLGLRGWCMNTDRGTVQGSLEGESNKVDEMKHWLQHVGSKMSRIDKAVFTNEREISKYSFDSFTVRH